MQRLQDGKVYALKRVHIEDISKKDLEDSLNEIRIMASFHHPRIVKLYETFVGKPHHHHKPLMGGDYNDNSWAADG